MSLWSIVMMMCNEPVARMWPSAEPGVVLSAWPWSIWLGERLLHISNFPSFPFRDTEVRQIGLGHDTI